IWSTYYGGANADYSVGICPDSLGFVYISGSTQSFANIATAGALQTSLDGRSDAYVAKFNANGKLIWGTYFGGSGNEAVGEISIDPSDNIYVLGNTTSPGIATSGAWQTSYEGGGQPQPFISKFSNIGQ